MEDPCVNLQSVREQNLFFFFLTSFPSRDIVCIKEEKKIVPKVQSE